MKIAFILDKFPRLSETYFMEQMTGLLRAGHEIDIIATNVGGQPKVHPDIEKFRLMERTRYLGIPDNLYLKILKAIGLVLTNFHKAPIRIFRSLQFWSYGCQALDPYLRVIYGTILFSTQGEHRYDVIHCHYGFSGVMGVYLRQIGVLEGKIITGFYGSDAYVYPRKWRHNVYENLFKSLDGCIVVTHYMGRTVQALGAKAETIHKLPVGLDLTKFRYKKCELGSDGIVRMATTARLVEKKGLEYSIRAVAKVYESLKIPLKYKIGGEGPLRPILQDLIRELGMDNQIELIGWIDQKEYVELLEESHIFILPSVTAEDGNKEGQALVNQEAQAVGLPVISTDHNGIPEGILDGKSGFIVPERDVDALAETIEFLATHPECWVTMGAAGREFVEKNYEIDRLNGQLLEIYEGLLLDYSELSTHDKKEN